VCISRTCRHSRGGFLLLDVLLGTAVFAIFIGFAGFSLLFGQRMAIKSGDHMRGVLLTAQAVEAVRSIRDESFENLIVGTHGVQIGEDGMWELSGSDTTTADGFRTQVEITEPEEDTFQVTSITSWAISMHRFGTASLVTQLTNWRQERSIGNWSNVSLVGSYIDSGTPLFNNIAIAGGYAFVTSETSAGGAGLYVFDISNITSPQRRATSFTLSDAGYQLLAVGDVLYLLTESSSSELQAYDISAPDTFSAGSLIGSYNLPGAGRARSLAYYSDSLFIGATEDVTEHEFYAIDVSDPTDMTFLDSVDDEGASYLDLSLHNGYAYIGSSKDVAELIVADIFDPTDITIAAGSGYNLTDVLDGRAVAAFGTSALLGRAYGDVTEEFVLFEIEDSPVPTPPPGPWYQGIGADVNGLDVDPTGKYAFVASGFDEQELQVMDVPLFSQGQLPRVEVVATDTGDGRSVTYDPLRDRVFLTTNTALLIYAPGP